VLFRKKKDINIRKESHWRDVARNFTRHKLAMAATFIILLEIILVIILPIILKLDPNSITASFFAAPSEGLLLGTDEVGRDVFARLLEGGRMSLTIGISSAIISALIGIPLGLLAGYMENIIRPIILRITDIVMAIPMMIAAMFIVAMVGSSAWTVIVVIGLLGWPGFCRLAYGRVISVKENEYVEAARAIGTRTSRIILKDILPNSVAPLLVAFSGSVASAIVTESSLSFLGVGIQPPQASWGNMVYSAQSLSVLTSNWWMWLPAGLCLVVTVLSINFIGDGLRDALDPKMKV
jgi:peptide/nickel transport system permease protein